jgi:sec-independent protein translocase protein TatB
VLNIGGGELLVIMLLALVVLGPQRLPEAARQIGRFMGDLRRMSSGFQRELQSAMQEPANAFKPILEDVPATPSATTDVAPSTNGADQPATAPAKKAAPRRRAAPLRAPGKPGSSPAP